MLTLAYPGGGVGMDVQMIILKFFVYMHTLFVRAANALARLCSIAGSSESYQLADEICTEISRKLVQTVILDIK